MASPDLIPMGTYEDVTGVVDATAQTEIAALETTLLGLIPDVDTTDPAPQGAIPFYDKFSPEVASALRQEITAAFNAIQAAPAS